MYAALAAIVGEAVENCRFRCRAVTGDTKVHYCEALRRLQIHIPGLISALFGRRRSLDRRLHALAALLLPKANRARDPVDD